MRKYLIPVFLMMMTATAYAVGPSSVNPQIPANNTPFNSQLMRNQFLATYNDLNTLFNLFNNYGSSTAIFVGTNAQFTNPSLRNDQTTGLYSVSPATLSVAVSGVNQGTFSSAGFSGNIGPSTVTATGTTTPLTVAQQVALTVDAQQFGALQNGFTTNDTAAINAAGAALSALVGQNGQVGFLRLHGKSGVCGVISYRNVVFDFQGGEWQVTNGCAATYPIASENYVANKASNQANICGISSLVPSWFGFRNAKIDCNGSGASYTKECVGFYGPAQQFVGTNYITNSKNASYPTINTIDANGGDSDHNPQCQEEMHMDNLIVTNSGGQGWWNSTHDAYVGTFMGGFNADCSFVGGGIDHMNAMHTYAESNGCGQIITGTLNIDDDMTDGDTLTIPFDDGPVNIKHLWLFNVGYSNLATETFGLNNQSSNTYIDSATCTFDTITPFASNASCIVNGTPSTGNANNSQIRGFNVAGASGTGANLVGITNYASGVTISDVQIAQLANSGNVGIKEYGGNNKISGVMDDMTTGLEIESGAATGDVINLLEFQVSGQSAYTGIIPTESFFQLACTGGGTNCTNFNNQHAGSTAIPSLTFGGDLTTGLWSPATSQIAVSIGGVPTLVVSPRQVLAGDINTSQDGVAIDANTSGTGFSLISAYGPSGDPNVTLQLSGKGTGGVQIAGGSKFFLPYELGAISVSGQVHQTLLDIGFNGSNDYTAWYTAGSGAADATATMVMSAGAVGIGIGTAQPVQQFQIGSGNAIFGGNVGIGTAVPINSLQVVGIGTSGGPNASIENYSGNTTYGGFGPALFINNHVNAKNGFVITQLQSSASDFVIANPNSPFQKWLDISQAGAISTVGSVGIGTTVPATSLDVYGSIDIKEVNAITYPTQDTGPVGSTIAIGPNSMKGIPSSAAYQAVCVGYNSCGGISGTSITTTATSIDAFGYNALGRVTTGPNNNAFGWASEQNITTASANNAFGDASLGSDATISNETAMGDGTLQLLTSGSGGDSAFGTSALASIITGGSDTAIGMNSQTGATNANLNTSVGFDTLFTNSTGNSNTAVGANALYFYTGGFATAVGNGALQNLAAGSANTAVGWNAANALTSGGFNVAVGYASLTGNGASNVAVGQAALGNSYTGSNGTAVGQGSGSHITSGVSNSVYGQGVASTTLTTGSRNILIGADSSTDSVGGATNNSLNIGNAIYGSNLYNVTNTSGVPLIAIGSGASSPRVSLDLGTNTDALILPIGTTGQRPASPVNGMIRYNSTSTSIEAYQNNVWSAPGNGSNAEQTISYQPGLLTAVNATKTAYTKFVKASTVDNIDGSANTFSCVSNPTITMTNCHADTSCATSPTTIGTVTITAAGQAFDGTISSSSIAAGEYVAWAITAGTCASVDLAATSQIHSN